jgi:hypothetical protein
MSVPQSDLACANAFHLFGKTFILDDPFVSYASRPAIQQLDAATHQPESASLSLRMLLMYSTASLQYITIPLLWLWVQT